MFIQNKLLWLVSYLINRNYINPKKAVTQYTCWFIFRVNVKQNDVLERMQSTIDQVLPQTGRHRRCTSVALNHFGNVHVVYQE